VAEVIHEGGIMASKAMLSAKGAVQSGRRLMMIFAVVIALGAGALWAQTPPTSNSKESSSMMKQFVLLFRQGPGQLSEADQKRLAEQVLEWAQRQNSEGRKLDPRKLGDEVRRISPSGGISASEETEVQPLSAILFLEARDFEEAVRIAESHPGLKFGASVEVRAWAVPQAKVVKP
jgi:hypothetical protein